MSTPYDDPANQALAREISSRQTGETWELHQAMAFFRAAKVVAAADGLTQAESDAIGRELEEMGVPEFFRQEILDFDVDATSLEEVLEGATPGGREARTLLTFAINVATVDGFGPEEQLAAERVAGHLGLKTELVPLLAASARLKHLGAEGASGADVALAALALQRAVIAYPS